MNYRPDTTDTTVQMRTMEVQGLNIFYREAGKPSRPKPGPFSFRKELANQAETELKGFVPRGVSLSRHAPMTQNPLMRADTHDITASSAHRSLL